jgi:hypothetical protein
MPPVVVPDQEVLPFIVPVTKQFSMAEEAAYPAMPPICSDVVKKVTSETVISTLTEVKPKFLMEAFVTSPNNPTFASE